MTKQEIISKLIDVNNNQILGNHEKASGIVYKLIHDLESIKEPEKQDINKFYNDNHIPSQNKLIDGIEFISYSEFRRLMILYLESIKESKEWTNDEIWNKDQICECKDEWMVEIRLNVNKCTKCGQEY